MGQFFQLAQGRHGKTFLAVSKLKDYVVFAWTSGLKHIKSPLAVLRPLCSIMLRWGD
jgi:hypothetical protein